VRKALGMSEVGGSEDHLAFSETLLGEAVVNIERGEHGEARVMVLVVAPSEKVGAVCSRVSERVNENGTVGLRFL
jgi:hypothetical protein